jgi:DNA repair protein RadD
MEKPINHTLVQEDDFNNDDQEEDVLISSLLSKLHLKNHVKRDDVDSLKHEKAHVQQQEQHQNVHFQKTNLKEAEEDIDDFSSVLKKFNELTVDTTSKDTVKDDEVSKVEENKDYRKPRLRDYQLKLVDEVMEHFEKGSPSILLFLPTGGGKTAIACQIVVNYTNHVGIFVHREELAWQMRKSLLDWGISENDIGFIKANINAGNPEARVKIVSIQTFASRYMKKESPEPPKFDLVLIDEAHHAMACEYLALLNMYPSSRFLGLTATPYRLRKGELLGDVFFHLVKGPSVRALTEAKWLVPSVFIKSTVSTAMVERSAIQYGPNVEAIVLNWKRHWSNRKSLAFCINLKHAEAVRDSFSKHAVQAAMMCGKNSKDERERLMSMSKTGDISVLITVDLISEGVDMIWIDCLLLLRPTDSRGLFIQQVGRGLRAFPSKDECIILDEVGNVFRHGFIDDNDFDENSEQTISQRSKSNRKTVIQRWRVFNCRKPSCKSLVSKPQAKCLLCTRKAALKDGSKS